MSQTYISKRKIRILGLALFAMFFGAGNLLFPPFLGAKTGQNWLLSFLCFSLMDIGLALLTLMALVRKGGQPESLTAPLGRYTSLFVTALAIICVGPLMAIPRTAATTYEMGIAPLLPQVSTWVFSAIFFALTLILTLKPGKVVDIVGNVLTPVLLLALLLLIGKGILSSGEMASFRSGSAIAIKEGVLSGYQAMDALGAICIIGVAVTALPKDADTKSRTAMLDRACLIAGIALFLIYFGLAYLGARETALLTPDMNQAGYLVAITRHLLGNGGVIMLSVIVALACLTTSVGLVSASANFFTAVSNGRISYPAGVIGCCLFSFAASNLGLSKIIAFSSPILGFIYPIIICQLIFSFLPKEIGCDAVCRSCALGASVVSIGSFLETQFHIFPFITKLPLYAAGLQWLLPAVLCGTVACMVKRWHHSGQPRSVLTGKEEFS